MILAGVAIFVGIIHPDLDGGGSGSRHGGLIGFGIFWLSETLQKWRVLDA